MKTFRQFIESEISPAVAQWRAMRGATQGLGSGTISNPARRIPESPTRTAGATQSTGLPNVIVDLLRQGFQNGGLLNDSLVRQLKLTPDHNLVAPNAMLATPQGSYPFAAVRKMGIPTGKITFVQGFPIDKAIRLITAK